MGPKWCKWIGAILSGLSASLFFLSLISFFTVLHLYNLLCFQFFIAIRVFYLFFFLAVWSVLLVKLVGAFAWIIMTTSFLSAKLFRSICRLFIVNWQKVLSLCSELRSVTSVSECLYKLDPIFALMSLNTLFYFKVQLLFLVALEVFFEFHLFFGKFYCFVGKICNHFLSLPCEIWLPAAALWLSLRSFPRRHLLNWFLSYGVRWESFHRFVDCFYFIEALMMS